MRKCSLFEIKSMQINTRSLINYQSGKQIERERKSEERRKEMKTTRAILSGGRRKGISHIC